MVEGGEDVQYTTVCMDWRLGFFMLRDHKMDDCTKKIEICS